MVEGQVVAEQHEAELRRLEDRHQLGQRVDVLAVDLDELERRFQAAVGVDRGVHGLHQRRFAHAAGAPQQRVVGRQAGGEAPGVVEQYVAHPVDAADQPDLDAVDAMDRLQEAWIGHPDETIGGFELGLGGQRRRQPRHGGNQPVELFREGGSRVIGHFCVIALVGRTALTCGMTSEKLACGGFAQLH